MVLARTGVLLEIGSGRPRSGVQPRVGRDALGRQPASGHGDLEAEVRHVQVVADVVADRLLVRLGELLGRPLVDAPASTGPLADDALVDQTCGRVPRELYLRLARQGVFRSFKDGKRVYAFWGEVRAALAERMVVRPGAARISGDPPTTSTT